MFKVKLVFRSLEGDYLEHESEHRFFDDAFEVANDIACENTGYGLEFWEGGAQIDKSKIFYFYPDPECRHTKYVLFFCVLQ